jgi:AFG3 family protein
MAYDMVTIYGMNKKVGNVSFYDPQKEYGFTKPYSEKTAEVIDEEVRNIIDEAFQRTKELLKSKWEDYEKIAQALLEKEMIFKSDMEELIGKRPFSENEPLVEDLVEDKEAEIKLEIAEVPAEDSVVVPVEKEDETTGEEKF